MRGEIERENWTEYSRRNQGRSTKLEVFGEIGEQREERRLPLAGVSVEDSFKTLTELKASS